MTGLPRLTSSSASRAHPTFDELGTRRVDVGDDQVQALVGYALALIHWAIPASRSRSNASTVG